MSCGAPKELLDLVDGINGVIDTVELGIASLPKRIASIPGYTEIVMATQVANDLKLYKSLLDDPLALLEMAVPSLPQEFQDFIDAGNSLVAETEEKLNLVSNIANKYGDLDIGDPEELLDALNDLGGDIDKLCTIIPNIQERFGELIEMGKPLTGTVERPINPIPKLAAPFVKGLKDLKDELADGFDTPADEDKPTTWDDIAYETSQQYLLQ
tara:strand:- start:273 stop:908 length:636 start_codon:yes stop_codon:yes gene_type:complete